MRPRVVHWLLTCHHPVAVDAAAACVDVHVQLLLLMLMSTAVAAGPTGIVTAGIARLLLTQTAGCSYSTVSAVVGGWGGDKLDVGVVLPLADPYLENGDPSVEDDFLPPSLSWFSPSSSGPWEGDRFEAAVAVVVRRGGKGWCC